MDTEVIVKLKFHDNEAHIGNSNNTIDKIYDGIKTLMEIDLEHDNIINKNWSVHIIQVNKSEP